MSGWPWPLDGVQDFFEDLWNWISEAAVNAVSILWDWIWDAIYWVKDRITDSLTWLWDLIEPLLGPVADWIVAAAALIAQTFIDFAKDPVGFISGAVNWIGDLLNQAWNSISAGVNAVGSLLGDALATAKDTIVSGVNGLASTISSAVGGAIDTLSTAFNGAMQVVGSWVSDALAGVAKALGDALGGFVSWLTEKLQWLAQSIIGAAMAVKDAVVGFFQMIGRGLVAMWTTVWSPGSPNKQIQAEAETAFKTMLTELEQLTKIERTSQPPYEALLTAIVSTAARFLMLKLGVEGIGAAVDAAHPIKGLKAHAIAAGLMGILDMPAVIGPILSEPIRQGIFIPWQHYWASRYTPQIPSYGDMIDIYVREGYLEEYQKEIPAGMIEDFRLLGYSEYWTKALWGKHWKLPATGQVFEMLHRGIITEDVMSTYLKTADILSVWRSRLIAISWDLPGRIDARWMAGWGLIDVDEYGDLLVKRGLDPEWRDRVAEATVKQQMAPEINKLRDNIKNDLIKGYILETDARTALQTLGFNPDRIEYHIQDAIQDRERRRRDLLVDNYLDAYIKEIIATEAELEGLLATVIVDPELVKLIVDDAYIRRYKKPKAD